jgi:hypothetical protein
MDYKFIVLTLDPLEEDAEPLSELNLLLADGWVPLRETPLSVALGGQCYSVYPAICLCLLGKNNVQEVEKVVD